MQRSSELTVDCEFAVLTLQWAATKDPAIRTRLEAHPALASLVQHQKISGNAAASASTLLDGILGKAVDVDAVSSVLDWARDHEDEVSRHALMALEYLPASVHLFGRIYLVTGYDIGIASPPDVAINVAHDHFLDAPQEIEHYATHEAHHLGFLALRRPPALAGLDDPHRLLEVVHFFTQMEGMAVHAAYPERRLARALETDSDYRIYTDQVHARSICSRYLEVLSPALAGEPLRDQDVGTILGAMSSSERLWYRVGALVSEQIEREQGRGALIASIQAPEMFRAATETLLTRSR